MGDNELMDGTDELDDQRKSQDKDSDDEREAAKRRVEKAHGTSSVAPVDDDVIIK